MDPSRDLKGSEGADCFHGDRSTFLVWKIFLNCIEEIDNLGHFENFEILCGYC